ncbi:MAG: hypothetical protein KF841_16355 [Phycisphaerae bacterium]|nr:hypothetical protein [Phycisphaerae bacterium]
MKLVKRLFALVFVAMLIVPTIGCGVATTAADNQRTIRRIADYDSRMLVDDLALFLQTNRTLRTSRWVID